MVCEYDLVTDQLLARRVRKADILGSWGEWVYEVGEPPARRSESSCSTLDMVASSSSPTLVRVDSPTEFCWRIRNLPYPATVYDVSVSAAHQPHEIIVRTSNHKFYKRIAVPDLRRCDVDEIDSRSLSWSHANNTLVITYTKPIQVTLTERRDAVERRTMKVENEGDVDCKNQ
ncbi:Protein DPCD [Pelomyxa schiedti]|nr:Protein DPCD [Pelomyxa schiedti]